MTTPRHAALLVLCALAATGPLTAQQPAFTIEQVLAPPFPDNLVAAPAGGAGAGAVNANGARNIWGAVPPASHGRPGTAHPDHHRPESGRPPWPPDAQETLSPA